ncbi:MAG: DUF2341 domain-containing protein, partial [Bacteroidales bacterium]|nr:DUF2341 domain-containing protein [Bacteroidales bacterium]
MKRLKHRTIDLSVFISKSFFLLLAVLFGIQAIYAQPEDYSDWEFSKDITINTTAGGTYIASDLVNYPLLLRFDNTNFDFLQAESTGIDIRFSASDGTHLPYEIERWEYSSSQAEVWVKVDQILGNNNTQYITMYWGNSSAPDSSSSEKVFDVNNDFVGVWHFQEDGNSTADGYKDATSNNNDGTGFSMTNSSDVDAYIGIGQEFDGSSDYIRINNDLFKDILTSTQSMTVSFWVKTDNTSYASMIIWEGRNGMNGFGTEEEIHLGYGEPNDTYWDDYVHFYSGDENDNNAGGDHCNVEHATSDITNWHHVAVTYDANGTTESAEMFFDGVSVDTETGSIGGNYAPSWSSYTLVGKPGANERYFDGIIDELRITRNILEDDQIIFDEATQDPTNPPLIYGNTPPTLYNIESTALDYIDGDGQVIITSSVTISDVDDTNLESAGISIGNYQNAEDLLVYSTIGNITGSWNSSTGVLTLSGTDTKTNYISALRSVLYENTSDDPNTTTRTISFQVYDGEDNSNTISRDINVFKANDNPTDISLTSTSVNENQALGTAVGTLSASDPDPGDNHTYSLVAGAGDTDNASFQIAGDQL